MLYVLDTVPSCDLYIDSVRVSLNGDVKLGQHHALRKMCSLTKI